MFRRRPRRVYLVRSRAGRPAAFRLLPALLLLLGGCGGTDRTSAPNAATAPGPAAQSPVKVATPGKVAGVRFVLAGRSPIRGLGIGGAKPYLWIAEDNGASVWDLGSGRLVHELDGQPVPVSALACAPNDDTAVTAAYSFDPFAAVVLRWDPATGKSTPLARHARAVGKLVYAHDGSAVVLATSDTEGPKGAGEPPGAALLIDAKSGDVRKTFSGHSQAVTNADLSADNTSLATASQRRGKSFRTLGELFVWDVASGKRRGTLDKEVGAISALAFAPDGKTLLVALETGEGKPAVLLVDPASGKSTGGLDEITERVTALAYSHDGQRLALGHLGGAIAVRNLKDRTQAALPAQHTGPVTFLCFSTDDKTIASGGGDRQVVVWETPGLPAK